MTHICPFQTAYYLYCWFTPPPLHAPLLPCWSNFSCRTLRNVFQNKCGTRLPTEVGLLCSLMDNELSPLYKFVWWSRPQVVFTKWSSSWFECYFPPGISVKTQWSLQVKDDVSDLYSRKTTSVISTGERRRQWSLQVRDDVSDLYNWETTSVISTGERRRQWSLHLWNDVSDLYSWETTSEISTGERRHQWSLQVRDDVRNLYVMEWWSVDGQCPRQRSQ